MIVAAQKLLQLDYASVGIKISWDPDRNKKNIIFKPLWQRATTDNFKEYFSKEDNGIAIITGEASDIFAIDCDIAKSKDKELGYLDGVEIFHKLINKHGIPDNTPIQKTTSGGYHYFFSLSKSLVNGLKYSTNTAKIIIDGKQSCLDVRGDGGCLLINPTTITIDNKIKKYKWIKRLVHKNELPATPKWLISILNNSYEQNKSTNKTKKEIVSFNNNINNKTIIHNLEDNLFYEMTHKNIEKVLDSKIAKVWVRHNGFDFKIVDDNCTLCPGSHISNNYLARQILEECYYLKNYSTSCKANAFNWERNNILTMIREAPATDAPYCEILYASFKNEGLNMVWTLNNRFLIFNGNYWEELPKEIITREVINVSSTVLNLLIKNIIKNDDNKEQIKQFTIGNKYIKKSTNVKGIIEYYRLKYNDVHIEKKLNMNNDILVCTNGTINLKTGTLNAGSEYDYITICLDAEYHGLNYPTTDIDNFMNSIFNDDRGVIEYVQKLLGYGITGRTNEQCWAIFTGTGSNGKGVLINLLESLMKEWFVVAQPEVFFETGKYTQGGPAPHLLKINKKRLIVREERKITSPINVETIKLITGDNTISARDLYQDSTKYVDFKPIGLPILCCNHKPPINVDDDGEVRRILVIPFDNTYTAIDDPKIPFDKNNTNHRIIDKNLKSRLMQQECIEQLLVWLINGSVKWYNDGFGKMPQRLLDAFHDYHRENDHLTRFIEDKEKCEISPDFNVNASDFRTEFNKESKQNISQDELSEMMKKRGFKYGSPTVNGKRVRSYIGLKLKCKQIDYLEI